MKFQEYLSSGNSSNTCKQMPRDRKTDTIKLIGTFHNSANMPKKLILWARELKLYQNGQKFYILA
jgi:hypothetical protein